VAELRQADAGTTGTTSRREERTVALPSNDSPTSGISPSAVARTTGTAPRTTAAAWPPPAAKQITGVPARIPGTPSTALVPVRSALPVPRFPAVVETRVRVGGGEGVAFRLPARGEVVAEARRLVRQRLRAAGCDEDTVETAVLLASELTTNAVRHTASPVFVCRVALHDGRVRLEVEDFGGTPDLPRRREPGPGDVDGRGLLLVDALCEEWYVTAGPHGGRIVHVVLARA
jgi:anti-sigma regulatory factor (Ser/Thr protein kinase)